MASTGAGHTMGEHLDGSGPRRGPAPGPLAALATAARAHWPECLMEALGLGLFMAAACGAGTLLWHPAAAAVAAWPDPLARRLVTGIAMGLTAVALIHAPWGRRSGAHLNPATTLAYWRLGKIAGPDAVLYALAQAAGGLAGVLLSAAVLGPALADPAVDFVATVPGRWGTLAALAAEAAMAFVLLSVVLRVSNSARLAPHTPLFVGALVAAFIAVEAPVSGTSMNPARSFASAVPAAAWPSLWIYALAPALGMLAAAEAYVRTRGLARVFCAKLHHANTHPCIFHCRHAELLAGPDEVPATRASERAAPRREKS